MAADPVARRSVSEDEFRELLAHGPTGTGGLDAAPVIRRARRRRRGAALGVASVSALAIIGIGAAALGGMQLSPFPSVTSADGGASEESSIFGAERDGADSSALGLAPVESLNPCGAPLAQVEPSATGLTLTPDFPDVAAVGRTEQTGTVTLTNTGTETVRGTTGAVPAITIAKDGITMWHSSEPTTLVAVVVDLDPGESMRFDASYLPVRCDDEAADTTRDDLAPLDPGAYTLGAALSLVGDAGSAPELITGPLQTITLE